MNDFILVARIVTASQLMLLFLILTQRTLRGPAKAAALGLLFCAIVYLLAQVLPADLPWWAYASADLAASTTPAMLVLFAWHFFDYEEPLPPWSYLLVILYQLTIAAKYLPNVHWPAPIFQIILWGPQYLKLLFAMGAIYLAWRNRGADLVDWRRQFRFLFGGLLGLATLAVIAVELTSGFEVPRTTEAFGIAALCGLALYLNASLLKPKWDLVPTPPPQRDLAVNSQDPNVERLIQTMQSGLYREHHLRVAHVADATGLSEIKLRDLINKQLGYGNFNRFVNHFRLEAAAKALTSNPSNSILSIALDAGFRSLSSFNTSFKNQFGCTPSEFRIKAPET